MSSFNLRGSVPLDSAAYVVRHFERRVLEVVQAGDWALLLGPRQHGKTSALVRVRRTLGDNGVPCAYVDLQGLPPCTRYVDLLEKIAARIAQHLGRSPFVAPPTEDAEHVRAWLEQAFPLGRLPAVIIIDEAAGIREPAWRDAFYGQLRALSNERADAKPEDVARRIRIVFSGTFNPDTLFLDDLNSPFNTCVPVDCEDLDRGTAHQLWSNVEGDGESGSCPVKCGLLPGGSGECVC